VIQIGAPNDGRCMRTPLLAAIACVALLAGCGSDGDGATAAKTTTTTAPASSAPTTTIAIKDFKFDPAAATVKAGTKITVSNEDSAPHTLTEEPASGKPAFDTGTLNGRKSGSFTATKPGTFKVYCVIHPFMKGTVTVQ